MIKCRIDGGGGYMDVEIISNYLKNRIDELYKQELELETIILENLNPDNFIKYNIIKALREELSDLLYCKIECGEISENSQLPTTIKG